MPDGQAQPDYTLDTEDGERMSGPCGAKLMGDRVPDEQSLFCNRPHGHSGDHAHTFEPVVVQTEMSSLTQIKAKLDETLKILKGNEHWPGLDIRTDNLFTLQATKFHDVLAKLDAVLTSLESEHAVADLNIKLDAIQKELQLGFLGVYESQGKLLEAISGLRESGMRNHQQIRRELAAVRHSRKPKRKAVPRGGR